MTYYYPNKNRGIYNSEHDLFRQEVRRFMQTEVVPYQEQWRAQGFVGREVWKKCGEAGLLGPSVPEEFSGPGLSDFRFQAVILEELAYVNEWGLAIGLHNSLVIPYILSYATDEQKKICLPKLVDGSKILAVAMTEPGAGSDLGGLRTFAERTDGGYCLKGQKTFISNGQMAHLIVVAARVDKQDPRKITLFLVDEERNQFSRSKPFKKMGQASQDTCELTFSDTMLSEDQVLGEWGQGMLYLKEKLAIERLTCAISGVALAEAAFWQTWQYTRERQAFGKRIYDFQNSNFSLARMRTEIDATWSYCDQLILRENSGLLSAQDACQAKYKATELASQMTDLGVQLHGGYGYMQEYPICHMHLDARIGRIYAGSNEIMLGVIAREIDRMSVSSFS